MHYKITTITTCLLAATAVASFTTRQDPAFEESKARGKEGYDKYCVSCHLADGKGAPGAIPPLAKANYFVKNAAKAIYAQKYGLTNPITVNGVKYTVPMPVPHGITDAEIADITTYIMNSWGNKGKLITVKDVEKVKP